MLDDLVSSTNKLIDYDEKASYFIAKELALLEINLMWFPSKYAENVARLRSLADHVNITFKNNTHGKKLAADIRETANRLSKKI
jgi:hypothetical protein